MVDGADGIEVGVTRTDSADASTDGSVVRMDRADLVDLARAVRTPEGYILAQGRFARAGVLTYRNRDGSIRRELLPPEELTREDSLATMGHKPLTLEHPGQRVNPQNWSKLAAGHAGAKLRHDGIFAYVDVAIMRADAIAAADGGTHELSAVYSCDVIPTSGTYDGQPYDAIQRNRRYRELALTEKARGGSELAIRMDADAVQVDAPEPAEPVKEPIMHPKILAALALFGVTRTDTDDQVADKVTKAAGELTDARAAKVNAEADAAKLRTDSAAADARKLSDLITFANTRSRLLSTADAAGVRLDSKAIDGMDNDALAEAVVMAIDPKTPKGKPVAYHEARLDSWAADGRFGPGSTASGAYEGARIDPAADAMARGRKTRADTADRPAAPASGFAASRNAINASRST